MGKETVNGPLGTEGWDLTRGAVRRVIKNSEGAFSVTPSSLEGTASWPSVQRLT